MRPGIGVSLELCSRAWRNVGVGGEHNTWCIKCAWLLAVEVAVALAAMAMRAQSLMDYWFSGYHPQSSAYAFAAAQNCVAPLYDTTSNFCEEDLAPCIAECHHTNKGVQCQAWDDVSKTHCGWEVGKI